MADNVEDPGTGATFATKETDVGTGLAHVQFVRETADVVYANLGPFTLDDADPYADHDVIGQVSLAGFPRGVFEILEGTALLVGSGAAAPAVEVAVVYFDPADAPAWPTDGTTFALPIFAGLGSFVVVHDFEEVLGAVRVARTRGHLLSIPDAAYTSLRAILVADGISGPFTTGDQLFVGLLLRRLAAAAPVAG